MLEKILKRLRKSAGVGNKGGLIAAGIHEELDELRIIASGR